MNDITLPTLPIQGRQEQIENLLQGRLTDPFGLLGPHPVAPDVVVVRTFQPGAVQVEVIVDKAVVAPASGTTKTRSKKTTQAKDATPVLLPQWSPAGVGTGFFAGIVEGLAMGQKYRLRITWSADNVQECEDPYAFGLQLGDLDLYLIGQGSHRQLSRALGANEITADGVAGTRFAVWAPNARRVSVVGDFNQWDGRRHPMRARYGSGVWELFIPGLGAGTRYKYELQSASGELLPQKADPVARATELPPATASVVASSQPFTWTDEAWMQQRAKRHAPQAPISVYEVHAASWVRQADEGNRSLSWGELAERLIPYVVEMGFTHVEFMPIMEHPFGGSWGYQPLSQFAPSARFGTREEFAGFVDQCHAAGIGVILDWVPAHFPTDAHGMAQFDGSSLYEHQDPREGFHQDWNTLIFNLGRTEVSGYLIASALEWLDTYHIDALRVDAVASMLYRDYSRKPGEWVPNIYGGRENLESVAFLQNLNRTIAEVCPGAMMIAEESTSWPGVTGPVESGGLGFSYKWNMGWMHDTLRYQTFDPLYRAYHHDDMTFGLLYAFSERFMLPISHDEVVHGKGSLLSRFPGDNHQKLANLRAYFGFMFSHPGKKLLFMGCELAQHHEWNHDSQLDWNLLHHPAHRGIQRTVRDLNHLYASLPALHHDDCDASGFAWLIGDDRDNSVFAYLRRADSVGAAPVLVVANMTPVARHGYRIGIPKQGDTAHWREIFNSDAAIYDGGNMGNQGKVDVSDTGSHGQPCSLLLTLPPLSVTMFTTEN